MPDAAQRGDGLRGGKVMRAWGVKGVGYGDYHSSSVTVAGLYAYPIAAFARIVAENPALQGLYGNDARGAAKALIGMYEDFLPELVTVNPWGLGLRSFFEVPPRAGALLTSSRCQWAYQTEESPDPADKSTFVKEQNDCNNTRAQAGMDVAYNETLIFVNALVELSRALDSAFYAPDAATKQLAEQTFPQVVARAMRYYHAALSPVGTCDATACGGYYQWSYTANPAAPHPLDDTSHASYEMASMGLFWRNAPRLNGLLASFQDTVPLSAIDMARFANTFVQRIGSNGHHLFADQSEGAASPVDADDGDCTGWLDLTASTPAVYQICTRVTLAGWNPAIDTSDSTHPAVLQPHLSVANHAALLANKVHLP
jgi:hypothetical protein